MAHFRGDCSNLSQLAIERLCAIANSLCYRINGERHVQFHCD